MSVFSNLNYPAIVVSALVYLLLGFVWYTFLPGKEWDRETVATKPENQALPVIEFFVSSLLFAFGVAIILGFIGQGIIKGISVSLLVIICFVLPINSSHLLFTKKRNLYFTESGFQILRAAVIGLILGLWK